MGRHRAARHRHFAERRTSDVKIHDTLRQLARQALARDPEPSISVLDSQSIKTTEAGGDRGFDGKK
jgi:transposase, IS4 family